MNEQRGNGRHSWNDENRRMQEQSKMQGERRFRDDDDSDRGRWGEDRDRGMEDRWMERGQGNRGESRMRREIEPGQGQDRGQGQSGYMAGRYGEDRSLGNMGRNQGFSDQDQDRGYPQRRQRGGDETGGGWYGGGGGMMGGGRMMGGGGMGLDERWTGRGGQDYWRGGGEREQRQQFGNDQYGGRDQFGGGYGGEQSGSRSFGGYGGEQSRSYGGGGYGGYGEQGPRQAFRGKGPKNFTRSDERLRELVSEALADDNEIDASEIEVEVKNGEVMLKGTVDDRYTKRLAEECVVRVSGVNDVQNQIRIQGGNKWQVSTRGNQSQTGQVGTNESDKSKHRA